MDTRTYFLDLFAGTTWQEFLDTVKNTLYHLLSETLFPYSVVTQIKKKPPYQVMGADAYQEKSHSLAINRLELKVHKFVLQLSPITDILMFLDNQHSLFSKNQIRPKNVVSMSSAK